MRTNLRSTLTRLSLLAALLGAPALEGGPLVSLEPFSSAVKGGSTITIRATVSRDNFRSRVALTTDRPDVVPVLEVFKILVFQADLELPTNPVSAPVEVVITGTGGGATLETRVTVLPPVPTVLELSAAQAPGGTQVVATATIDGPAPFTGFPLEVACLPAGAATSPSRAAVAPGETQVSFPVFLHPSAAALGVQVRVSASGAQLQTSIGVTPPALSALALDPVAVTGGETAEGEVTLDAESPAGGTEVVLKSADASVASVERGLLIPAGARSARFPIATQPVAGERRVEISAVLRGASVRKTLAVAAPALAGLVLSPGGTIGSRSVRGRVLLAASAAVDTRVALASADIDLAVVPDAVTVPAGESMASFLVATSRVFEMTQVTINAALSGDVAEADLRLVPAAQGDWEGDGDIDLLDFAELQMCFTGPLGAEGFAAPTPRCAGTFDFDGDGDLDHDDFEAFQGVMAGAADGLPDPTVTIDPSLVPEIAELPGIDGGPARPVAAIEGASGSRTEFVEDEVIVEADGAELDAFLARWAGRVIDTFDPSELGGRGPVRRLVRIDGRRADTGELREDLRALNPGRTGDLRVSSDAGLELLAALAGEARRGLRVKLNGVPTSSTVAAGTTADGGGFDAFQQSYFTARGPGSMRTGVTEAWQMLQREGKLASSVLMAAIDRGFNPNPDFPALSAVNNGTMAGPESGKEWHGTWVSSIAVGTLDNGYGAAGVTGPIAARFTAFNVRTSFDIPAVLLLAPRAGIRIVNISLGSDYDALISLFADTYEDETRQARASGTLVIVSAGNEGADVDEECCFLDLACWECSNRYFCENAGATCIGALANGSREKAGYSNWGAEQVGLFAPGTVTVGPDPFSTSGVNQSVSGTSFASPFVAGVAALVWAADPSLTADGVESILFRTATRPDNRFVPRIVDARAAVLEALGGDLSPEIRIVEPRNGQSYPQSFFTTDITFHAEASDPDGSVDLVTWRSDRQGLLGVGPTLIRANLAPGRHVITATVLDAANHIATDQVTIQVAAVVPTIRIIEPLPGRTSFRGQTIFLRAASYDRRRGGKLPESQISWSADETTGAHHRDPGTGHAINFIPDAAGTWRIRVRADDGQGGVAEAEVSITVLEPPPDLPPTAVIEKPGQDMTFPNVGPCTTQTVDLNGRGLDPEDGEFVNLTWVTDRDDLQDPILGKGQWVTARLVQSCGGTTVHNIRLRVVDRAGNMAESAPRRVTLVAPPR